MQHDKPGVYVIEQIGTSRFYIGSSKGVYSRWSQHKAGLRKDKHHSPYLQNAWNKYGEEAFRFWVLEECDVSELEVKEQQYISAFKPEFNAVIDVRSRLLRSESLSKRNASLRARAAKITHCPHGHEYTSENTHVGKSGKRQCKICNAERVSGVYAKESPEQREARRIRTSEYYEANKEALRVQTLAYRAEHKADKAAYDRVYRIANRERLNADKREWKRAKRSRVA